MVFHGFTKHDKEKPLHEVTFHAQIRLKITLHVTVYGLHVARCKGKFTVSRRSKPKITLHVTIILANHAARFNPLPPSLIYAQ